MKLMNKIPVLDKGYVAVLSKSITQNELNNIKKEFFDDKTDKRLLDIPRLHLVIKCPLFVQLNLANYGLSINVKSARSKFQAYIPSVSEVGGSDLETASAIADDIKKTTEALLINPEAYQLDKCDYFISQVIVPISLYNNLIVSGSLKQWVDYVDQRNLPFPIEQYRKTIQDLLLTEWHNLNELTERKADG